MNTHTHTLSYYCKALQCSASFSLAIRSIFPTFSSSLWRGNWKRYFRFVQKEILFFLHFSTKKAKKWKTEKNLVFPTRQSVHVYSSSFFFFFSASEILNTKHHQRKGENEKARAHITATTHEHRKCLSSLRLIVPSCTHSPRNTTSSQKEKEKEEE